MYQVSLALLMKYIKSYPSIIQLVSLTSLCLQSCVCVSAAKAALYKKECMYLIGWCGRAFKLAAL